jgi:hypothetical protein
MKSSKPELFDYGIQSEDSHVRAHVCPTVRRIYVYPTAKGIKALPNGKEAYGYQPGVEGATAKGNLVKPFNIENCVSLQINDKAWTFINFKEGESTTEKGAKAVKLIVAMIRVGLFPLPAGIIIDPNVSKAIQIKGDDIYVWTQKSRVKIQVKCDFRGGEKNLGGTGHLYLQTAERNPLKKI